MSKSQVNGITSSKGVSVTLDHFTSYPLVSDLLSFYKSNSLGARSIEISQNVYNSLGKPIITSPLVQNPYSYIYPYAKKVDELGDNTLSHVDANFPAIKDTDFSALKTHAGSAIHYPFQVANDGRNYVFTVYRDEYKKTGGDGLVTIGKAILVTEIRVAADALKAVINWVGPKGEAASDKLAELTGIGQDKLKELNQVGQEKAQELNQAGQDKAQKAKKTAYQKKDEVTN